MTRSLLRSLLGGLLTLLTLGYSLSAQNDTPEQLVIYSHDQNQQVVKKTFDISQVDSIRFAVVEAPATTTFEIKDVSATASSVTLSVVPSDSKTTYYVGLDNKTHYDKTFSTDQAYLDNKIQSLRTIAKENGKEFTDYLKEILKRGAATHTEEGLDGETEYYICVFGLDETGRVTTPLHKQTVKTLKSSGTGASSAIPESPVPFGSNKDQIAAYEASEGTTLDNDLSGSQGEEYMYVYRVNKSPMIMRIYYVSKDGAGELNEYWAVMDNYDEVFQEADGKISLTESFIASLTKSGYTAPIAGDEGTFLSSKGDQYDLMIMPGTGGDLGIEVDKIVVLDFAPRGEFIPKE